MKITTLTLVDPSTLDDTNTLDADIWIDSCAACGTFENGGDLLCSHCDDLAA